MSRDINKLVPELQDKAKWAIAEMESDPELKAMGVSGIYISETKRDLAVQMAYYSRGRMAVKDVKKMYSAAGLYAISEKEAKTPNTQTLSSKHIKGEAIDLYPIMDGVVTWNPPKEVQERMGAIGKKHGMEWGGDWTDWPDRPHFQI